MTRESVSLAGVKYPVARDGKGARLFSVQPRPSQRGDPSALHVAEWRVDGPDLNSFEQIPPGAEVGYLGRDYGDGTDGRNEGVDTLGPEIVTLPLSTHDTVYSAPIPGTATFIPGSTLYPGGASAVANANGMAVQHGPGGTPYGYVIRGSTPAKVDLSDMSLQRGGEQLQDVATSILATRAANGTREISAGMDGQPYRVLTAISTPPNSDTWATNSASKRARILGVAPDRIAGLADATAAGNILTGSVTMAAPNWNDVATIDGELLTMTGFAIDGSLWVVGTSNGPYMLDVDAAKFFPLIDEIDNHDDNCVGMTTWFPIGVIVPLRNGVRQQKFGSGESWGAENFLANTSPVQGRPTAHAGSTKWLYQALYNPNDDRVYLVAWRPRRVGDPQPNPLTPHVIGKLAAGIECGFMEYLGTVNGVRSRDTLAGGNDGDLWWLTVGDTPREIDDPSYRYTLAGTTHLTEARRHAGLIWDLEAVEFESWGVTANLTITFGWQFEGGPPVQLDGATDYAAGGSLNGVVDSGDGFQRLLFVDDGADPLSTASGRRPKPRLTYASNVNAAAPQVVGALRLFYRLRALSVNVYSFTLELDDGHETHTAEEQQEQVLTEWGAGPVQIAGDLDQDTYYVRVESVRVREVADRGGGEDSSRGSRRIAEVVATEWATAE